ncbi:CBS domain-containing protein [Waterburya agarophytonicola K14]|uniref:CBS domain-containing protein n=2 Tax=Waterburya TaxID=2886915 RepID=A0A964BUD2_9CYAN|nr:CBS domain-containing protein [Waterburya agarophytonicola KI4]
MPSVSAVMRPFPYFADPETSVSRIINMMDEHQIRHLPIKQGDRLVGIVSERDLRWLGVSVHSPPQKKSNLLRSYCCKLINPGSTKQRRFSSNESGLLPIFVQGKIGRSSR